MTLWDRNGDEKQLKRQRVHQMLKLTCHYDSPVPLGDLCTKLYNTSWGNTQNWQEFDLSCEYNPMETQMLTCLSDVREPCQLGCRNLTYCTNFNNRPTELFRSCNAQSDQGAMNDMKLWEKGSIKMPFMNIPVLDIRKCHPEMWKAIACSLQIKPCHSKSRGSIICKRLDCFTMSLIQWIRLRKICWLYARVRMM
ncbi:unnamed protein product [Ranitomeya imitator]|uniref:FZ domain-containing protein n=1 Tax=Ranitomeya imitator TaxID=111125 RepID=A0ABN9MIE8_9NEOB|nr:unnamed protein product [Ranitomeya imitator]